MTTIDSLTASQPEAGVDLAKWQLSDFDVGKKIGEGRFGKIYLARLKQTKQAVVLKVISKHYIAVNDLRHQVRREIEIQHYCGTTSPHVLKLLAYFWDEDRIFLVLEYAEGGDLFALLKQLPNQRFEDEHAAVKLIFQCASALHHLHRNGIIHRDVKPENILIKRGCAKLADFSWAVRAADGTRRQTLCGTLDYLSPEVISQSPYSSDVDMWGLGVVFYELLVGRPPFERLHARDTCVSIQKGEFEMPAFVSPQAADAIRKLLEPDVALRYSAEQLLAHPLFDQVRSQTR